MVSVKKFEWMSFPVKRPVWRPGKWKFQKNFWMSFPWFANKAINFNFCGTIFLIGISWKTLPEIFPNFSLPGCYTDRCLENSSSIFFGNFNLRGWFLENSSIDLFSFCKISGHELDLFLENSSSRKFLNFWAWHRPISGKLTQNRALSRKMTFNELWDGHRAISGKLIQIWRVFQKSI